MVGVGVGVEMIGGGVGGGVGDGVVEVGIGHMVSFWEMVSSLSEMAAQGEAQLVEG